MIIVKLLLKALVLPVLLLTSERDDTWSIYTFNSGLKHKLANYARQHPDFCRLRTSTKEGSETYEISDTKTRYHSKIKTAYLTQEKFA